MKKGNKKIILWKWMVPLISNLDAMSDLNYAWCWFYEADDSLIFFSFFSLKE